VSPAAKTAPVRAALRRLMALARRAARLRSADPMRRLEAGIRFLRRGHTAGELRIAEAWAGLPERALLDALVRRPAEAAPRPVERIELIGVLLIEPPRV
jgi:hypothetical protein